MAGMFRSIAANLAHPEHGWKTTHFWGPVANWGLVGAAVYDATYNGNKLNLAIGDHNGDKIFIKLGNMFKEFFSISCKEFYNEFVVCKYERPTAMYTWEELYYYANFDWKMLFKIPYKVARETNLQSLQYQIFNRYIAAQNNDYSNVSATVSLSICPSVFLLFALRAIYNIR